MANGEFEISKVNKSPKQKCSIQTGAPGLAVSYTMFTKYCRNVNAKKMATITIESRRPQSFEPCVDTYIHTYIHTCLRGSVTAFAQCRIYCIVQKYLFDCLFVVEVEIYFDDLQRSSSNMFPRRDKLGITSLFDSTRSYDTAISVTPCKLGEIDQHIVIQGRATASVQPRSYNGTYSRGCFFLFSFLIMCIT